MPQMNMIEAIRDALDVKMSQDSDVLVFGEDVGYFGGVFRATAGLQEKHGLHRCFDTPISEGGIVGIAIGMAANGLRPVAEIQFADYIYPAYDQIASEAARLRYRSNGDFTAPLTIRTPVGGGIYGGPTHSQSPEALFTHIAGLKTIIPSNPYDAKGMLIDAIEDNDPVLFLEPKRLYNGPFYGDPHAPSKAWRGHELGEVPSGHYTVEMGKARKIMEGSIWASRPIFWTCARSCRSTLRQLKNLSKKRAAVSSYMKPHARQALAPSFRRKSKRDVFMH